MNALTPIVKKGLLLLIICSTLELHAQTTLQDKAVLNIYNWADYIDPQILEDFEKRYGINVNYDIYDSSEIVDTKLMIGHSGYDIVFHSASFSARLMPI
ncbi:MAG: putrescine transport system substrate-binding protein, partial [Oceanicoccus sp.]